MTETWLIYFDDANMRPEVFSGPRAEEAAKARAAALGDAWNLHLFVSAPSLEHFRDAWQTATRELHEARERNDVLRWAIGVKDKQLLEFAEALALVGGT